MLATSPREYGLDRFIEACSDPQRVKQASLYPETVNKNSIHPNPIYWHDLSLADGFPSFVLFFSTLDHLYPQKGFDLIAHRYVLEIQSSIEKNGPPQSGSLFSGTAGICYALAFASKNRTRYVRMLASLEEFLSRQLYEYYIPQIEENIQNGKPSPYKLYDVIQGFAGIGLYLLQNNKTENTNQLIKKLLQLAVQLTFPIDYQGSLVPGWICPPEFLSKKEDKTFYPFGMLNMGLAHGVPGLLGFMAVALRLGIDIPGQREAMNTIIQWLKSKVTTHEDSKFFQAATSFEQEINKMRPLHHSAWSRKRGHFDEVSFSSEPAYAERPIEGERKKKDRKMPLFNDRDQLCNDLKIAPPSKNLLNREAWCYGTPGVARVLYLAGVACQDADTVDFAKEVFVSIFKRPYDHWKLAGPTFCHGTAGVLLITQLMAKDLKDPFLFSKAKELEEIFFGFYEEKAPFGFRDFDLCKNGDYFPIDKVSLLTGSSGAWLTWLSTQFENIPQWHFHFMIDHAG